MRTIAVENSRDLALAVGFWASIVHDFFIKAAGFTELKHEVMGKLPHVRGDRRDHRDRARYHRCELCTIYRTQFGVLSKYERVMRFDANGRQVPSDIVKAHEGDPREANLGHYVLPFTPVDRENDMTRAHEVFTERLRSR
ncbi:Type II restriction enzyme, methylase subunits [Alloactinosynnema sp. L-07]|nr:Type II restriction enzyme, methylase subunits [Alloactinosynnema sp. L-07]